VWVWQRVCGCVAGVEGVTVMCMCMCMCMYRACGRGAAGPMSSQGTLPAGTYGTGGGRQGTSKGLIS
jgi:hypothetical protein